MAIIKKTVSVTYHYELEIDNENNIVKEYADESELINHMVDYKMSNVLPVVGNGVTIKSFDVDEWDSWDSVL